MGASVSSEMFVFEPVELSDMLMSAVQQSSGKFFFLEAV